MNVECTHDATTCNCDGCKAIVSAVVRRPAWGQIESQVGNIKDSARRIAGARRKLASLLHAIEYGKGVNTVDIVASMHVELAKISAEVGD